MEESLKDKCCIVYDAGSQVEFAIRMSKEFGKVYYFMDWQDAFPSSKNMSIGTGFKEIERIDYFWDHVEEADIIIFTSNTHDDLQIQLQKMGKRVWGSRRGNALENDRVFAKELMKRNGLPVNEYKVIIGVDKLKEYLKDSKNDNKYIKCSLTRLDFESMHHVNWKLTEPYIIEIEHDLGPIKDDYEFIVESPVEAIGEFGYDGYTIDGVFPDKCLFGIEVKDAGYCSKVIDYKDIIKPVEKVNKGIFSYLKNNFYRNFISTEVRITDKKEGYCIDFTSRLPSPPGEIYQEIIENLGMVIWKGSNGEMEQPIFTHKYAVEVIIRSASAAYNIWTAIYFPENIRQFVKIKNLVKIGDTYYFTPLDQRMPEIGAVIGLGNTLEEAIKNVQDNASQIEGYKLDIKSESLSEAKETIEKSSKIGVKF